MQALYFMDNENQLSQEIKDMLARLRLAAATLGAPRHSLRDIIRYQKWQQFVSKVMATPITED